SARSVGAQAFAVGRDVVFGAGAYRPGTASGRRLIAHELVHTIQQGGVGGAAQRAVLQREPVPSPDAVEGPLTPAQAADRAEAACDMLTLCQLHFSNPAVVSKSRTESAALRCRPGIPTLGAPCLSPAITNPALFALPPAAGPTATPAPTTPPAAASGGLPDLSGLTKFEFKAADATFTVDLPSSAKVNLPVEFKNSFKITFELVAKSSGAFSFSITLDGIPHVQLKSTTTVDAAKKSLTSDLMISSTHKTCHAPSPKATKDALQKAGDALKTAIQNVNKSDAQLDAEKAAASAPAGTAAPVAATPPEGFERAKRLADVVSGIVGVKKAVDAAQKGCEPAPTISFGITGQTPLDPSADDALPGTITGGLKILF
ncbi:MAG: DUF4157 domain-containing protein, partial [Rhodothermales bacterium]|nr:DUF4157 domain-containing protein [Rhodothermales bacterium]